MATTVPQSIRDQFAKAKAGTQGLSLTDEEGYQWIALSPQTYGGGDQGASTVDGIYMGGGGPISHIQGPSATRRFSTALTATTRTARRTTP
jgi:hypothetical protein